MKVSSKSLDRPRFYPTFSSFPSRNWRTSPSQQGLKKSKTFLIFSLEPRLYKRVCPSVGPSVRRSVGPSVRRSVGPSVGPKREFSAGGDKTANDLFRVYELVYLLSLPSLTKYVSKVCTIAQLFLTSIDVILGVTLTGSDYVLRLFKLIGSSFSYAHL